MVEAQWEGSACKVYSLLDMKVSGSSLQCAMPGQAGEQHAHILISTTTTPYSQLVRLLQLASHRDALCLVRQTG